MSKVKFLKKVGDEVAIKAKIIKIDKDDIEGVPILLSIRHCEEWISTDEAIELGIIEKDESTCNPYCNKLDHVGNGMFKCDSCGSINKYGIGE